MEIEITSSTEIDSDNSPLPSPGICRKGVVDRSDASVVTSIVIDSDEDLADRREIARNLIADKMTVKHAHSVSSSSSDDSDRETRDVRKRIRIPLAERLGLRSTGGYSGSSLSDSPPRRTLPFADGSTDSSRHPARSTEHAAPRSKNLASNQRFSTRPAKADVPASGFGLYGGSNSGQSMQELKNDEANAILLSSDSEIEPEPFSTSSEPKDAATSDLSPVFHHKKSRSKLDPDAQKRKEEARVLKEKLKEEALKKKELRLAERQEKQLEKEREKLKRKVENQRLKNYKPAECLKNLKVMIDTNLMKHPEGATLLSLLQSQEMAYELTTAPVENSLYWIRKTVDPIVDETNELQAFEKEEEENHVLVFVPSEMCLQLVQSSKQQTLGLNAAGSETLLDYTRRVQTVYHGKHVAFLVKGISEYFRKSKSKQQRQHRQQVLGDEAKATKRKRKDQTSLFDVTELDLEESIISVQVNHPCNITLLESTADVAATIIHHSKAIAQIPYKNEKGRNQQFSWMVDNQKAIAVTESGEGLLQVWKSQIQQFNNTSVEMANAIASVYQSPLALLAEYEKCSSNQEGRCLLQDLEVRREAGPLSTTRRVGPELSRKMYLFFTSDNPNLNLNAK